jgi:hypothetical protein
MTTLRDVRITLRDLVAHDERGEADPLARRAIILGVIADLEDFELHFDQAVAEILARRSANPK